MRRALWVLLDETPHDDWDGLSLVGLFWSRSGACDYLLKEVLEPDAEVRWACAPDNEGFWEGWLLEGGEETKVFLCVRVEVQA